ncbi:MAG TPA: SDR family NAD(P)-dependent oxidoreductase [Balneolaceae bacterium]|nr:SDR family NAD(P)-dependent oxidoreductase [Balneolaceae bacterium]
MNLSNNTILITGGTSGIGLGLAKMFLESDNTVIICGRRENRLNQIKNDHPNIITRICDVSKDSKRKNLFERVTQNYPDTNILINNAGIQLRMDLTQPVNMDDVRSEIDVNFYAPVHLSSLFARHLSNRENGAIINISSGLAFTPMAAAPNYCASKAAVHSFTMSLRFQLRNTPVKVFEIIPPSVDTELGHQNRSDSSKSHGGMDVSEFVDGVKKALISDQYEAPIGPAKNLHAKREALFDKMNQRF